MIERPESTNMNLSYGMAIVTVLISLSLITTVPIPVGLGLITLLLSAQYALVKATKSNPSTIRLNNVESLVVVLFALLVLANLITTAL